MFCCAEVFAAIDAFKPTKNGPNSQEWHDDAEFKPAHPFADHGV